MARPWILLTAAVVLAIAASCKNDAGSVSQAKKAVVPEAADRVLKSVYTAICGGFFCSSLSIRVACRKHLPKIKCKQARRSALFS